jgi:hypothetical protein
MRVWTANDYWRRWNDGSSVVARNALRQDGEGGEEKVRKARGSVIVCIVIVYCTEQT